MVYIVSVPLTHNIQKRRKGQKWRFWVICYHIIHQTIRECYLSRIVSLPFVYCGGSVYAKKMYIGAVMV